MAETRTIHRDGAPAEINLKDFYQLSNTSRKAHIDNLKQIPFNELSQVDLGVVFFYYQNWLLEDWPGNKLNYFSFDKETSTSVQISSAPVILDIPKVEEVVELGIRSIKKYLNVYFDEEYKDWEPQLKFSSSAQNFIEATCTFMYLDELCRVHIYAYKSLLK